MTISIDLQIPCRYLIHIARSAQAFVRYWPKSATRTPITPGEMVRGIQTLFGLGAYPDLAALRGAVAQDMVEGCITANMNLDDANLIAQLGRFGRVRYSAAFLNAKHRRHVEAEMKAHNARLKADKALQALMDAAPGTSVH
jgi:hypothetical protein